MSYSEFNYYVVIFGKEAKAKPLFSGEIFVFKKENKQELKTFLKSKGFKNNHKTVLGGKCLYELEDKRSCAIFWGKQKIMSDLFSRKEMKENEKNKF